MTRANILPRKRERMLARYGAHASLRTADRQAAPAQAHGNGSSPTAARDDSALAHRCPGCGYTYSDATGAPREGFPAGTAWSAIPDDWACPDCGVREKVDFEPLAAEPVHSAGAAR